MSEEKDRRKDDELNGRVSALESDVRALTHSFDSFAKRVESSLSTITNGQKTPWGVLATWAAVMLSVIAMLSTIYLRDANNFDRRIERLENRLWEKAQNELMYYKKRAEK